MDNYKQLCGSAPKTFVTIQAIEPSSRPRMVAAASSAGRGPIDRRHGGLGPRVGRGLPDAVLYTPANSFASAGVSAEGLLGIAWWCLLPYRSPLYNLHRELGANFTVFAGWEHPVDYGSVVEEHMAVRRSVGVFDLSHLGRLLVKGGGVKSLLDKLVPRRLNAQIGFIDGPTVFLNEKGGIIDDVLLYPLDSSEWLVVANAARRDRDAAWLERWATSLGLDARVEDITFDTVLIAVQGPEEVRALTRIGLDASLLSSLVRMQFVKNIETRYGRVMILSRSGWTGEDGFEIYTDPDTGERLFRALVEAGAKPCGLGARDSLRMEMGYPLVGHEIDESVSPIEARYWMSFSYDKIVEGECVGCEQVWRRLRDGVDRVRLGLRLGKGVRAVPRQGDKILVGDREVGVVTSGAYSPILKRGIGQVYVETSHALPGLRVVVERGRRRVEGKLVDFPFITPSSGG